jgi:hypothetical protein
VLYGGYLGQDLIPPSSADDLTALVNPWTKELFLSWTSPGDDLTTVPLVNGSRIFIATTTVEAQAANESYWYGRRNSADCEVKLSTGPINPGQKVSHTFANLAEKTTYYFVIFTLDQANNWSSISAIQSLYIIYAPEPIVNLAAYPGDYGRTIRLRWTAPQNLASGQYAIQRSSWSDVVFTTKSVDVVSFSTAAVSVGTEREYVLKSLTPGTTYYIRMWVGDGTPLWSYPSNLASNWAQWVVLSVTLPTTYYNFGTLATAVSTDTARASQVINSGNVVEDYLLSAQNSSKWALGSSPGPDRFTLRAAFHPSRPSQLSDFDINDNRLTLTNQTASGSLFTINGSQTGIKVDPFTNDTREMWLKLAVPTASSSPSQQDIILTITAQESP